MLHDDGTTNVTCDANKEDSTSSAEVCSGRCNNNKDGGTHRARARLWWKAADRRSRCTGVSPFLTCNNSVGIKEGK